MLRAVWVAFILTILPVAGATQNAAPSASQNWAPAMRAQVLSRAEQALADYAYPEEVAGLRAAIEQNREALMQIESEKAFAETLTRELQSASGDKHLIVWYSQRPDPNRQHRITPAESAAQRRFFRYVDEGYNASARLTGNVGYIWFGGFADLAVARGTIDAAMTVVGATQALIVDLRGNGGGDSDTVNYLLGYFFSKPVEVTGAVQRVQGTFVVHRTFTPPEIGGPRYAAKPVYVLVDRSTISGGEMFAYDMQSLHRATIIGEVTQGAANGLGAFPTYLDDHLRISVPDTILRNPYTGTNWEGGGVLPNLATTGKAALLTAYHTALNAVSAAYDPLGELALARKDPAAALAASLPQI